MVGAGDVCGFEVAYGHAFVMHDMVDFGDRHHGRVCHVQAFARLLAGIQKTAAEQVSEAGVVPCGVEIAHQHVQIVVMLQLGERVETTVPQTLVAGARRERVDGAEAHLAAAEIDRRGGNAA